MLDIKTMGNVIVIEVLGEKLSVEVTSQGFEMIENGASSFVACTGEEELHERIHEKVLESLLNGALDGIDELDDILKELDSELNEVLDEVISEGLKTSKVQH